MGYTEIRCQEGKKCPYNRRVICCFGEIDMDGMSVDVIERHKCKYAKGKGTKFVIVHISNT